MQAVLSARMVEVYIYFEETGKSDAEVRADLLFV